MHWELYIKFCLVVFLQLTNDVYFQTHQILYYLLSIHGPHSLPHTVLRQVHSQTIETVSVGVDNGHFMNT